jgi:hypothetical protein
VTVFKVIATPRDVVLFVDSMLGLNIDPEEGSNTFLENITFYQTIRRNIPEDRIFMVITVRSSNQRE